MDVPQYGLPRLSIVVPAYNECGNLGPLVQEIESALDGQLPFEVIIVNDGSSDGTGPETTALMSSRGWLRLVNHDRNRGQSAAIWSGVQAARAPAVAMLDGDGQNDPADIPALLAVMNRPGIALVTGVRRVRRDSWLRRVSSRVANAVRARLLDDGAPDTGCGLKLFGRQEFLALPRFDHMHRFLPALFKLQGGRVESVPVNHRARRYGRSKYGIRNRLWAGVIDLVGVMWLARRRI